MAILFVIDVTIKEKEVIHIMLRAAVIALATFIFSVGIAGALVLNPAFGQTMTPNPTTTVAPTTSPTTAVSPSPQQTVGGDKVVPSGAPNTGRGGY